MKRTLKFFAAVAAFVMAFNLSGCEEPVIEPTVEITINTLQANGFDMTITSTAATSVSYQVTNSQQQVVSSADVNANTEAKVTVMGLQPETTYTVSATAKGEGGTVSANTEVTTTKDDEGGNSGTTTVPSTDQLKVEIISTSATTVDVKATVKGLSRVAYVAYKVAEDGSVTSAPSPVLLFVRGTIVDVTDGENTITVPHLSPNAEYVVYFAGEFAGQETFMEEIVALSGIHTTDFTEDVRIYDIGYNGFRVDLKVDPSIKEQNHVIKMGSLDLYNYHSSVLYGIGSGSDYEAMDYRSDYFPQYCFQESATINFYENGEFFGAMLPGQPQVVFFGEFAWGKFGYDPVESYAIPLFDYQSYMADMGKNPSIRYDQAPYWNGFYFNEIFQLKQPEPLDIELKYNLSLETNDATVTIQPNDEVLVYCVAFLTSEAYKNLMPMLMNNEDYRMWWTTSSPALQEGWTSLLYADEGALELSLSDIMQSWVINSGATYHMMITAIGGDQTDNGFAAGNKQTFVYESFTLPEFTKPAPTVEVTAVDATPNSVSYRIRCTSGDAEKVSCVCNYDRNWQSYGGTDEAVVKELLDTYGSSFAAMEIDAINSAEGYVIEFTSKPYTENVLAVKVTNDEGRVTYSQAVSNHSLPEVNDTPVEIPALDGTWTMSATVATVDEATQQRVLHQMSGEISIGTDHLEAPETLTEEIYANFASVGSSREETDAFYAEFKEALEVYISTIKGQNRVLLNGWALEASGAYDTRYATPFELFSSLDYNGYNAVAPIYDFGPKWFIEFDAEGNAWVPYNIDYYGTMSSWTTFDWDKYKIINEYFLMATNEKYNYVLPYGSYDYNTASFVDGKFPVEISEDGNTITIKALEDTLSNGETITYYPNMVNFNTVHQQATIYTHIASEIVLTRGSNASAQQMNRNAVSKPAKKQVADMSNYEINLPARKQAHTYLPEPKAPKTYAKKIKWAADTRYMQQ